MKTSILHKVISAIMAILVMLSTLSITIEKHYCGDHLVDVALFTTVDKCGTESSANGVSTLKKHCCKDVIDLIEGQDELSLKQDIDQASLLKVVITPSVYNFKSCFVPQKEPSIFEEFYPPPRSKQNIYIFNQVFLI